MSVYDVAAVDRLNSLRRRNREGREDSSTSSASLSRGSTMSLSRNSSMSSSLTSSPIASPFPSRKSLPQPSVAPSPARDRLRRREERSYRTVAATATKSSLGQERQGEPGTTGDVNRKEEDLLSSRYPRLSSHSTYSLPRNTRLYKSCKRMTESLRESQESLLLPPSPSTSTLHLPESRDSLLKRYPSSSLTRSPSFSSTASSSSRASSPVNRGTPFREATTPSLNYPKESAMEDQVSTSSPVRQESRLSGRKSLLLGYHSLQTSRRTSPVRYDSRPSSRHSSRQSSPLRYDSLQSSRRSSPIRYDSLQSSPVRYDSRHSSRRSSPIRYDSRHSSRRSSPARYDSRQSSKRSSPTRYDSMQSTRPSLLPPALPSPWSRSGSPAPSNGSGSSSHLTTDTLNQAITRIRASSRVAHGLPGAVVYVRETVQVVEGEAVQVQEEVTVHEVGATADQDSSFRIAAEDIRSPVREEGKIPSTKSIRSVTSPSSSTTSSHHKADKAVSVDLEDEDKLSIKSKTSERSANRLSDLPSRNPDLSNISRSDIEGMLECLTQRVRDIEAGERGERGESAGEGGDVAELTEVADSGRAESIASGSSSISSRGRARRVEAVGEYDPETQSTLRRQSVIIEGLTMETEELRKKCQQLEEEVGCGTPLVDDLSNKLQDVETRLEESENYCYQVIEENVEMKSEIETLEAEIAEVQDTFRDKDAKEFKKTKWELENLSKTCRNLQLKLGKAQAKAARLKQEKEEAEDLAREQMIWKTTALVAAAAVATYAVLSRVK